MNRNDSSLSKAEPPGQFKIAQALQFENQMKRISQEIEKLMQIVSQHGLKIKELSTVAANSVSQVEFMSAITTTRFQALNVVKSMKTENQQKQSETVPISALNDNSSNEDSHEIKHLKQSLQQLENEQFNQNFKNNMENKRLENDVKSARKEMNDMKNYIFQLEKKLELFVDAVEDAGINTNVSFVGNENSSALTAGDDVTTDQPPPTTTASDNNQPVLQGGLSLPQGVIDEVIQREADVTRLMDDSLSDVGSPLGSPVPSNNNNNNNYNTNNNNNVSGIAIAEKIQRDRKQSAGDLTSRPRKMSNSSQRHVINKSPDTLPNATPDDNPSNSVSSQRRPSRVSSSAVTSSELKRLEADVTQRIDDAIQRATSDVIARCQVDTGAIVREVVRRQADVSTVRSLAEAVTSEALTSLLGGFSAISEKALAQHRKDLPTPSTTSKEVEEGGDGDEGVVEEVQGGEGDFSEVEEKNVRASKTRQGKKSRKSVRIAPRQSIAHGKGKDKGSNSYEVEKGSGRKRHVTFQRPSSEAVQRNEDENSEEEEGEIEGEVDRDSDDVVVIVKNDVAADSRPSSRQAMVGKQSPARQATPPRRMIEEVEEINEKENDDDRLTSVTGFKLPDHLQPRPLVPIRDGYEEVVSEEVLGEDLALPDDLLSVLENAEFTERLSLLEPLELEDLSSLVSSIVEVNFDHLHLPQMNTKAHVLSLVDEGVGEDVVEEDSRPRTTPSSSPRASGKGSKPNTPRHLVDPPMPFVGEQGMDNDEEEAANDPPVIPAKHEEEEEVVVKEVRQVVRRRSKAADVIVITDELSDQGTPRAQTAAENTRRETVTNTLRVSNTPAPPSPSTSMAAAHALTAAFASAFPSPPSPTTAASPTVTTPTIHQHYEVAIDTQPVVTIDEPNSLPSLPSPKPNSPRTSKPNSPRSIPAPVPATVPVPAPATDPTADVSNPYPINSKFQGPVPRRLHLPTTIDVDSSRRLDIRNILAQRGWLTKEEWEKELMTSFETQIIMKVYDIIQRKLQRLCNEINDRFSIIDKHTITLIEQGNYVVTKVEKLVQHQQTVQRVQRHLLSTTHYLQLQSAEVQTINKDLVDPLYALLSSQREEMAQCESLIHGLRQRVESLEREKVSGSGRATLLRQQQQQHQQQHLVLPSLSLLTSDRSSEAAKVAEEVAKADSFLYEAKAESLLFGLDFLSKEMRRLQATYHDITTQQEVLAKKVEKVVAEQAKPSPRVIKPFSPTRQASASGERERGASSLHESTQSQLQLSKEVLAKALTEVNVLDLPSFQPLLSDVTHMKKVVQICFHLLDAQQRGVSSQGKSRPSPHLSNLKEFHFLFNEDENEEAVEGVAPPHHHHRPTSSTAGFSKKGRNLKEVKEVVAADSLPYASSSSKATSEQRRLLLPKATPTNTPSNNAQPNKEAQAALLTQTMQYLDFVRKVDRESEIKFSPTPPVRPRPPPYITKPSTATTSNTPSIPLQLSDSFSSQSDWVVTPND